MEAKCPNCKKTVDRVTIDEVVYINCPECGSFQIQADGSMIICELPGTPTEPSPEPEPEPTPELDHLEQIDKELLDIEEPEPEPESEIKPDHPQGSDPASTSEGLQPRKKPSDKPGPDDSGIEVEISFED